MFCGIERTEGRGWICSLSERLVWECWRNSPVLASIIKEGLSVGSQERIDGDSRPKRRWRNRCKGGSLRVAVWTGNMKDGSWCWGPSEGWVYQSVVASIHREGQLFTLPGLTSNVWMATPIRKIFGFTRIIFPERSVNAPWWRKWK